MDDSAVRRMTAPAPTSAAELPAHGDLAVAPVIPAKGDTGLAPGSPAVVVVQSPEQSPTIRLSTGVMVAGLVQALTLLGLEITSNGILHLNLERTLTIIVSGAITSAVGYLMRRFRLSDNNPVDTGKAKP